MAWTRLRGEQYVRLMSGAAEAITPYVGVPVEESDELVVDLLSWPENIQPTPMRGLDGRLIAGDPVLADAGESGLVFASGRVVHGRVIVPWELVRSICVVGQQCKRTGA